MQGIKGVFVTGTDTDVGKTIIASWLMLHLDGYYWKPIQSGLEVATDQQVVKEITGFSNNRFFPSCYELTEPLSPHESAKRDGIIIDMQHFVLPQAKKPIIVEGAGGVLVPINENQFIYDLIKYLKLPTILVCRSQLGTINHTLLSLKLLRDERIPILGIVINGPITSHNRQAIEEYGQIPIIGEIDILPIMSANSLLNIQPKWEKQHEHNCS